MNQLLEIDEKEVSEIYEELRSMIANSKNRVQYAVNVEMINLYWNIGKRVYELQDGEIRAKYGTELLSKVSKKLTDEFGSGFSIQNLRRMRQFYKLFPIRSTVMSELSWSHYLQLIRIDNEKRRNFYLEESIKSNWSVRQLERQINSFYYERLLATSDNHKEEVRNEIKQYDDDNIRNIIKDPYVLEFLDIKDNSFLEKDLESNLLKHISEFLLELGHGFSFVARQRRIDVDGDNFYIDLVFYNYYLKCFILIDLKLGKLTHQDIGQMDFYVRYFDNEIKNENDNPTIGIILCSDKKNTIVKYSVLNDNKNLFASKYKLYLPTEEELTFEIEKRKTEYNINK